jgi:mycothiol synthase
MSVHSGVAIRPFRWENLFVVHQLIVRSADTDQSDWRPSLNELEHMLRLPGYDAEMNCFVAFAPDGELVGYSYVDTGADPTSGQFWGLGAVHPDFRRRGIGTVLLQTADARALEWANTEIPMERPAYIQRPFVASETGTMALLTTAGHHEIRRSYTMLIDLRESVVAPSLPADGALTDGITLRPFVRDQHGRAVHAALEEAFRDHWGHTDMPYDTWAQNFFEHPNFDPSLWLVAYDGAEIAGVCMSRAQSKDQPTIGFIPLLGVRRPWRKRGLGLALLKLSFQTLRAYGFAQATLGVDAQNTSNAVALYERAGMHVHKIHVLHRKILRGNEADIPAQ